MWAAGGSVGVSHEGYGGEESTRVREVYFQQRGQQCPLVLAYGGDSGRVASGGSPRESSALGICLSPPFDADGRRGDLRLGCSPSSDRRGRGAGTAAWRSYRRFPPRSSIPCIASSCCCRLSSPSARDRRSGRPAIEPVIGARAATRASAPTPAAGIAAPAHAARGLPTADLVTRDAENDRSAGGILGSSSRPEHRDALASDLHRDKPSPDPTGFPPRHGSMPRPLRAGVWSRAAWIRTVSSDR